MALICQLWLQQLCWTIRQKPSSSWWFEFLLVIAGTQVAHWMRTCTNWTTDIRHEASRQAYVSDRPLPRALKDIQSPRDWRVWSLDTLRSGSCTASLECAVPSSLRQMVLPFPECETRRCGVRVANDQSITNGESDQAQADIMAQGWTRLNITMYITRSR